MVILVRFRKIFKQKSNNASPTGHQPKKIPNHSDHMLVITTPPMLLRNKIIYTIWITSKLNLNEKNLTFFFFFSWFYQTDIQLNGLLSVDYVGIENTYGCGGYVQLLSPDANVTTAIIEDLMANLWIDKATRVVFLDFTIYNANINLFCAVKLAFTNSFIFVAFLSIFCVYNSK